MTKKALRKNSQPSAADSELFRALLTATADAVYSMSPDWREMRRLNGKNFIANTADPSDDWLDKYIHPDDRPGVLAAIEKAIRDRNVFELEHRVIRADGSPGWTVSRAVPVLDAAGEIVEWLGTAKDVTERKQFERALREREAQLETELADTKLLQALSAEMSQDADAAVLYQKLVDGARDLMRSDSAGMQALHPERGKRGELYMLASSGLGPEAAKFWEWIRVDSGTSCAMALSSGKRVVIDDLEKTGFFAGTQDLEMMRRAGVRAMQTTPLYSRGGRLLGMISTHWRRPYQPSERDLRLLDILARQAADLMERMQAQETLRQSEARYRNIFQNTSVSIWEEDFSAVKRALDELKAAGVRDFARHFEAHPQFLQWAIDCVRVVDVNDATLRLFGAQEKHQLLGSPGKIFLPETAAIFSNELLAIAEERGFFEGEAPVQTLHGEPRHVLLAITFPPPGGDFSRVAVTLVDITQRKRAEHALRESAQRLQLITDTMPALISYVDADRRYRFNNRAYQDWFGYSSAEFSGKSVEEVVGAAAYARVRPRIEAALAGRHVRFEEEIPYRKAGMRSVIAEYVPDIRTDGSVAGFYGLIHDITERKELEEKTRRLAQRLQLVADAMPTLISYIDCERKYRFNNKAYQEWFGYTPRDILGKSMQEVLGEAAYERLRPHVAAALSGRRVHFEGEIPYQRGGVRSILGEYMPDIQADGSVAGFYVLIQDITERKRAERALESHAEEIERSRDVLREADRRKDEFLATLAHELRNPLAPIRQAAQLLKMPGLVERDAEWARDVIERQVRGMARLLDDLLDLSRISRGKLELRRETVELADIVESALELARPLLEAKQHALHIELPEQGLRFQADPLRLSQIISNLLTNAAKYTNPGGAVRLRAGPQGEELLIRVSDNGIGIDPGMLPRIFDMFSQAAPALERIEGGLGVGLALVRGFVELHGGSVHAHSAGPGRGSEFTVRLPLAGAPAAPPEPETAASVTVAEPAPPLKILIVDDNRDAAETLAILIGLQGFDVRTSFNGRAGLEAAETFRPDIALLDIGMPELNGYEMARRIRGHPWGRRTKLIAVTGWGQEDDKRRAIAAGFDYHLRKPIDTDFLRALLGEQRRTTFEAGKH